MDTSFDPILEYSTEGSTLSSDAGWGDRNRLLAEGVQERLQTVFSRARLWEMEKVLGYGSYGVTILLRYKDPLRFRRNRRAVLKRPYRDEWLEELDDIGIEIAAYKKYRGHAHIARMLAHSKDLIEYKRPKRSKVSKVWHYFADIFKNPEKTLFPILGNSLEGPAILLEYLENGSLEKLQKKLLELDIHLPNRVLWSFYHCLIRACVGMAYPVNAPKSSSQILETIPSDENIQAYQLAHRDIAPRNVMIGSRNPAVQEHRLVPGLKLIDFGLSVMPWPGDTTDHVAGNLFACTATILTLINRDFPTVRADNTVEFNGYATQAVDLVPTDDKPDRFPHLDPELRNLITLGLASPSSRQPSLSGMLEMTRAGMMKPASAYPGREVEESDARITQTLQTLMYDA
ncbi:hypothetical protein F4861DRAFT_545918 [Xylaria intraflava]|nr:hypothetical protein F4861DRAFT_545918 [Xylaria intraflava]